MHSSGYLHGKKGWRLTFPSQAGGVDTPIYFTEGEISDWNYNRERGRNDEANGSICGLPDRLGKNLPGGPRDTSTFSLGPPGREPVVSGPTSTQAGPPFVGSEPVSTEQSESVQPVQSDLPPAQPISTVQPDSPPSGSGSNFHPEQAVSSNPSDTELEQQPAVPVLRQSNRITSAPIKYKDFICHTATHASNKTLSPPQPSTTTGTSYLIENYFSYSGTSISQLSSLATIDSDIEPKAHQEAHRDSRWCAAMAEEVRALEANRTWRVEEVLAGKHPIDCKWVFKIKRRTYGTIERFKARLYQKVSHRLKALTSMRPLPWSPN
ncbi:hypothetical protein CRG98_007089 [Punica granatum]|uniref:Reverse transcriptase Ty1/copia-type domain-containing protein n=1 Tax=Punica granatum TaxID=22663 RepID=A0A2I0KXD2_PUNGR|nr:hypothetical protein CRG98_007089 [Punica granatum]